MNLPYALFEKKRSIIRKSVEFSVMYSLKRDDSSSEKVATIEKDESAHDINCSIQYTRWFFRLLGIWPHVMSDPSKFEKNMAKIVLPLSSFFMIILTIQIISYMTMYPDDFLQLLALFGPVILQISNLIKKYFVIYRADLMKICLKHMEQDWARADSLNDRNFMLKNVRFSNSVTKLCAFCSYCCSIWYHTIRPLSMGTTIDEWNATVRSLPYPGADIYLDLRAKYMYELVFISNNVSALFHFTVGTTICNIAAVLVCHACGQIQIVISRLECLVDRDNVDNGNDVAIIKKRITNIIKNHVRVLKFTATIERVLSEIFLTEVIAVTLIICYLLYYCITEWSNSDSGSLLMYVLLLFSFTFNLLIFCHVSEILKEQCQAVGKAAYMIEWYKLPKKTNLFLIMIITISNRPAQLTAGGMMDITFASFASILKTSLAYLNMLRTLT